MSALSGKPEVILAFENISGNGNLMYLDNLKLTGATGINEDNVVSKVNVYPNPSSGAFTVDTPSENSAVTVYNLLGESVIFTLSAGSRAAFDISDSPAGIYVVKVKTEHGESITKVVKE